MAEMDAVTSLCTIEGPRFAYALSNGTTGIYSRERRAWRVKVGAAAAWAKLRV